MSAEEQVVKQGWLATLLIGSWKSFFQITIYYGAAVIYPIFRSSRIARRSPFNGCDDLPI
jgi:hypothetical protein